MIAYHFPPLAGSSGIQRTLRFVQHLPRFGWQPLVLTTTTRAYERTSHDLDAEVPSDTIVQRAFALDSARHLSLWGRHLGAMTRPDRWMSWKFDGVRQGMKMIRELRPDVLWSTFPIATAHAIGAELHRRSQIPWVADFRDPMAQEGYPTDPATWQQYKAIEEQAIEHAQLCMFTTPGAARAYRERYPGAGARIELLENGYDEESFVAAQSDPGLGEVLTPGAITLLHSGIVYPEERDPAQLFAALGWLLRSGHLPDGRLKLRFRAPVHDDLLRALAKTHGIENIVEVLPAVGYQQALREMLRADALLVMQDANCNAQIPAKLYEYLRAGRPILCLSDPAGDTEALCRDAGLDTCARLDDAHDIARLLQRMLAAPVVLPLPSVAATGRASRLGRTQALAEHLDRIARRSARLLDAA